MYMHFDHLDEIYAMVKSNLQFDKLVLTGLTGLHNRSDRSAQIVQQTSCVPILDANTWSFQLCLIFLFGYNTKFCIQLRGKNYHPLSASFVVNYVQINYMCFRWNAVWLCSVYSTQLAILNLLHSSFLVLLVARTQILSKPEATHLCL